ncbi:SDR family NAD(P)-dependent oxidoreductase [Flavobacterium psychrophilum]|uniref:SDR family NAD(P)-dependent oxidoreductase n=2 Tax=Flavobacterium psychrophilum TaxID=96345 RepID=A0A7U2NEI7_FLAPS|nr:SDR family NAD(P)-dependent oxidoreductase [Flavobacterium psychrophilum]EKT4499010.1 SDR family NAD(P)-dependent oxidoreductase [Flavobacterium psychrophilum]ELM3650361.1 SDR family NAD(P)-dependent oxidoreductase [Flavobacterium psychrophilum]ELM3671307.1 SDR family NAD(P)-dependent oxidoreductase [Flavobacterium psychrophilum]ELM3725418.1 SDR family NAD(P)-dependent oxidoreductase [Flavobacterium psychrophilum]ELV7524477.1 SDR family NAD(P)-dependent oxidoreductase [Flavobacterium psychr
MKKILIITGGNKGIGSGIVWAYKNNDYQIISIARTLNLSLEYKEVRQIILDLSKTEDLENTFSQILNTIDENTIKRIIFINNAGTLGKIGRLENNSSSDIQNAIQVNTITPFLLTSIFLKETQNWNCSKKIINISSGAAVKPYYGWSLYCASKAAIDMMTKAVAVEQETIKNRTKIIAIYPGVVDTDMQFQIRKSSLENFIDIQRFIDLKESNSLINIETIGQEIFKIDALENYPNGAILTVSDYRN